MITLLLLRMLIVGLACYWLFRLQLRNQRLTKAKESWKSLALATEVQVECIQDYYTNIEGEGCMTRSRRREKDREQSENAENAADDAKQALIELGEYEE